MTFQETEPPPARTLRNRRTWLLVVTGGFLALFPFLFSDSFDRWKLSVLFGNEMGWVLDRPEQVTVYRLDYRPYFVDNDPLDLQRVGQQPVTPSPAWRRRFRRALAAPGYSGYFREQLACGHQAGIGVECRRGSKIAHLLICFGCGELSVASPDRLSWAAFPVDQLGRLAHELYPDFSPLHD